MLRSLSCLPSLLLCGCTTITVHVFHGRVENLVGDGWVEEGTRTVGTISSKPSQDSGRILSLSIDPAASFVLRHPAVEPGKTLQAHSTNADLRAWLIRDPRPVGGPLLSGSVAKDLDMSEATPLNGELELHWRNDLDFVLRVDVRSEGTNGSALRGRFEARRQREFEPNLVWMAPAMMMGDGNGDDEISDQTC